MGQTETSSLLENDLNVTRRRRMNHFVSHMIGEMLLQLRVALEERRMALIRHPMKIIDLGDKAVPVLPKDFDRLHRQGATGHVRMKPPLEKPAVGQLH